MAERLEQERLQARKARLIKQNDTYRSDLQAETENLRGAAEWIERGFAIYKTAARIRKWSSPIRSKKRNSVARLLQGCTVGLRILKKFKG